MSMYWVEDDWTPTVDNINELPKILRSYIHALHTECDPAGTVQRNVLMTDMLSQANAMIVRIKAERAAEIDRLRGVLKVVCDAVETGASTDAYEANLGVSEWRSFIRQDVLDAIEFARAALAEGNGQEGGV